LVAIRLLCRCATAAGACALNRFSCNWDASLPLGNRCWCLWFKSISCNWAASLPLRYRCWCLCFKSISCNWAASLPLRYCCWCLCFKSIRCNWAASLPLRYRCWCLCFKSISCNWDAALPLRYHCGVDVVLIEKKGATMVSQMVISGSKNAGPPWFLKCILYLGSKGIRYSTSSTIGDDCSSVNWQDGSSFLLIKRAGGKKKRVSRGTKPT
jgi:hypothetical protein